MAGDLNLIPGLPDEIGRECLIRAPYDRHPTILSVCKRWRQELESPHFQFLRQSAGLARPLVALVQAEPSLASAAGSADKSSSSSAAAAAAPPYRLTIYDPSAGEWTALPPIPSLPHGLPLFCRIAAAGRELVIVGGWDPQTYAASDAVHVYSFSSGAWRRGARMPGPRRSFFACAGAGQTLLVAGGHDDEKNALRSALAYDVVRDEWAPLPDMAAERDECRGVVLRGRFHVVGGYSTEAQGRFSGSAEAFDVATGRWGPVEDKVLETGTCPRTCTAGPDGRNMYMCVAGRLVALDGSTWRAVAELPEDARAAPQVAVWAGNLMLTASGKDFGGATVGYLLELKGLTWRKLELPPEYSGHVQAACCLEI